MIDAGLGIAAVALFTAASAAVPGGAGGRHLIYMHGRIVQEEQSARPRHPRFGYYELEMILDAFPKRGFVVTGEIRPKAATVSEAADHVVEQVRRLPDSGLPAENVTLVGASMGGGIALVASARLQNPELRVCVLGACLSENVAAISADEGRSPSGRLLSIRESSDDLVGPCPAWDESRPPAPSLSALSAREIVLSTGLSHGFLYQPLPEWVEPVARWASDR
jgi:pimeloyl-ACP methyl ester carboxylesterase